MHESTKDQETAKIAAGRAAAELVEDGQIVGLGSGTSAWHFIRALGERVATGLRVTGVPASTTSKKLAEELSIPLAELDDVDHLDLVIDGADEICSDGSMIKGGGANLLWEKILATSTENMIIVVDPSKAVPFLGKFPLPIEVTPHCWGTTRKHILSLLEHLGYAGANAELRMVGDGPLITDNGNYIIDAALTKISDPEKLTVALNTIPGVVENGLFVRKASSVVWGFWDGSSRHDTIPFWLDDLFG